MDLPLTITDVAKQLKMSKSTIYKYTETGKIPSIKIGSHIRIMENDLIKYLQSCKTNKGENNEN